MFSLNKSMFECIFKFLTCCISPKDLSLSLPVSLSASSSLSLFVSLLPSHSPLLFGPTVHRRANRHQPDQLPVGPSRASASTCLRDPGMLSWPKAWSDRGGTTSSEPERDRAWAATPPLRPRIRGHSESTLMPPRLGQHPGHTPSAPNQSPHVPHPTLRVSRGRSRDASPALSSRAQPHRPCPVLTTAPASSGLGVNPSSSEHPPASPGKAGSRETFSRHSPHQYPLRAHPFSWPGAPEALSFVLVCTPAPLMPSTQASGG